MLGACSYKTFWVFDKAAHRFHMASRRTTVAQTLVVGTWLCLLGFVYFMKGLGSDRFYSVPVILVVFIFVRF